MHIYICLFDFVKTWPLGFRLAPDAARLQASAVSKKAGALTSWPVQLDSPGTALTVGGWTRPGGKINGVGRGLFWHSSLFLVCPGQLSQASAENDYHDNCRAQWEAQKVTHCRGWESQGLGTKDILSIGPVYTHWSHVYINSVRY